MIWKFDDYTLDDRTRELRRDGHLVAVEGRVFDLLAELATHTDRVVTKDELIDSVWRGRIVSDTAISSCIKSARAAIGDNGQQQRFIKTIHGKGYRLVGMTTVSAEHDHVSTSQLPKPEDNSDTLPAERFELFGRERDIEKVSQLLSQQRLVSLLGVGGTGKTRLALATGRSLLLSYPDGVWFIDLVPVADANGIDLAIAQAIGLTLTSDNRRLELARLIKTRQLLLILDNCEHLIDQVAQACDEMLEQTLAPRLLVTSRIPLNLADEFRLNVEPLAVDRPAGVSPAVELFCASAARLGVSIESDQMATVSAICSNLDGLPLAIELAASQMRQLTLAELWERLDKRFELLTENKRSGSRRQSSLQGVLSDTWEMLDSDEQHLLGQLVAFPELFSITDIEELTTDDTGHIISHVFGGLVDKSLVKRQGGRWRLLETVRLFAQRQLTEDEQSQVSAQHANWCLARIGDTVQRHWYSSSLANWCASHFNDLLVAESHLNSIGRSSEAAHLVTGLSFAMHRDGGARAGAFLTRIEYHLARVNDPALVARLRVAAVMCSMALRSPKQMASHGEAGLKAAQTSGDGTLIAIALVLASWSTALQNVDLALTQVRQAAALALEADDHSTRDFAESYMAWHLAFKRLYDEALDVARAVITRHSHSPPDEQDYPVRSAACAIAALGSTTKSEEAALVFNRFCDVRSEYSMWSMKLLSAYNLASVGRHEQAVEICKLVNVQLLRAGLSPLPDLLIPAAFVAYKHGEDHLAASWLRAVKDAGVPTQSFIMTIAYRRLSDAVGPGDEDQINECSLDKIGAQALQWIHQAVTRRSSSSSSSSM